jgi:hypothetical protein
MLNPYDEEMTISVKTSKTFENSSLDSAYEESEVQKGRLLSK